MTEKQLAQRMIALRLPSFPGVGLHTRTKNTVFPSYSGRFFLGTILIGTKRNGRVVFTNSPY